VDQFCELLHALLFLRKSSNSPLGAAFFFNVKTLLASFTSEELAYHTRKGADINGWVGGWVAA